MKAIKIFLLGALLSTAAAETIDAQEGYVHKRSTEYVWPTDQKVLQKLDNWQDLKFGVIFHWGIYAVPGIVESWSICSEDENWIPRDSTIGYDAYKKWYWDLSKVFNPTKFNPDQWAKACKDAGMKYVVFTTKHHDGFCMFDTKQTSFSIANGPFGNNPKRDVAKYVFESFRNQNFMIGAYFSKPDWHSPYYWWPRYATPNRNPNYDINKHPARWEAFQKFTYNQISELMHNYGSIDILWLDGGQVRPPKQDIHMDKIAAMAREAQPGILMVDRTVHGMYENYQTPEQSIPSEQLEFPWESCITLGKDWGWNSYSKDKPTAKIISSLIEIVAKGGSLLLGVGPTPEGLISDTQVAHLKLIGDWMKTNGEAIYNTRSTAVYHDGKVWFTAAKDKKTIYALYALDDGDKLPTTITWKGNVPGKHSRMTLLQTGKTVKWSNKGDMVTVTLPKGTVKKEESIAFRFTL